MHADDPHASGVEVDIGEQRAAWLGWGNTAYTLGHKAVAAERFEAAVRQHADFAESLRGTIDPEYAWQRTQDQLAGRDQPEISLLEREVFQ